MESTESNTKLLFELSKVIHLESRQYVPILDAKYDVYKSALSTLLVNWLEGTIGTSQPTESWEKDLILAVNAQVNGQPLTEMDTESQKVYDALVAIKVPSHFRIVTSHRHWLQKTLSFCQKIGVKFSGDMDALIRIHDLSKYTHREVIGYAVMFGDGSASFRVLEKEEEKHEWQATLNSHYAANPHHPEYFGIPEKGQKQTNPMADSNSYRGIDFVEESVIDMLAAHGERNLAQDEVFSITKWMGINPRFLARYEADDKKVVDRILEEWLRLATSYLSNTENMDNMYGLFGDRKVCVS